MRILLASPELSPYVRESATGDTAAGLVQALQELKGGEVTVALPAYPIFSCLRGLVRRRRLMLRFPYGGSMRHAVWTDAEFGGMHLLLLEKPEYFDRASVYGLPKHGDFDDNLARFAFWARAVLAVGRRLAFDVVHALDWPGTLVSSLRSTDDPPVTLGLAGLGFPGDFAPAQFPTTGLPWEDFGRFEFYGRVNCAKAGLLSAAAVVFPGERLACAVQSAGAGSGLEGVAREVVPRLCGILAGVDYRAWYDAREAAAAEHKGTLRAGWLREAGLDPIGKDGLLVAMPLDLAGGGLDLLLPVLDRLMEFPLRLAILGRCDPRWAPSLQLAAMRHAGRLFVDEFADGASWPAAAAASDVVLLADALEPADLVLPAMMRAGVVPVVQSCPGLHEIVQDDDPADRPGNGLVFYRHHPEALWDTFRRVFALRSSGAWPDLVARAAATDFSWAGAGPRYAAVFERVIPHHAA